MPELQPCPFCGKDAQIAPDEIGSGGQHVPPYHAGCLRGAGCGIAFTADDPDEAIAEWNRRALSTVTPAEVGGMVERLRYAENVAINDSHAAQTELSSTPAADNEYADNRAKLCAAVEEAISLIQSQAAESERWRTEYLNAASDAQKFAARIAELEAGLRPVAQRCDEAVRPDDNDNDGVTVKTKHLRAARTLLNGERKG